MGEKRGFTGKLTYDFEVSALLEIQGKTDTWVRVTAREFRSWDGPRRITHNYMDESTKTSVAGTPQEYWGPLFIYGTNTQVEYHDNRTMVDGNRASAKNRDKV